MTSQLRQRYQASSQSSSSMGEDGNSSSSSSNANANNNEDRDNNHDTNMIYPRKESVTELPVLQENGQPAMETTEIPSKSSSSSFLQQTNPTQNEGEGEGEEATPTTKDGSSSSSSSDDGNNNNSNNNKLSQSQVAKAEGRKTKIATRVISGALMIALFLGMMYMGHLYICLLVALTELLLFRELVRVRYSAFFHTIQDTIPLFRTTQWLWFAVAIFYTYGDFMMEIIIQGSPEFQGLLKYAHFIPSLSFVLYSGTFVMTIATMQVGHIKFQLNQLCWTIVVLCLTVGQLKYIMHNIFNGLYWFALPILLVVTNDIMAYVSGMTCGRKFIRRKFISFSPNKTWEGFIGGWIFTMVAAWYISKGLAHFPWMYCPTNKFQLMPDPLDCTPDPIFVPAQMSFPSQLFDLLPRNVAKMIPGVVEICSVRGYFEQLAVSGSEKAVNLDTLTPCVSGNQTHSHHHFELFVTVYPVQMHALVLALFASLVAPFGGFLASAIKRAYRLKDFDSLIPGHGGVMDRMDCQLLMALCTWVHYNTFVKIATISVPKLTYMYNQLSEAEKREFLESIAIMAKKGAAGARGRLKELEEFSAF